jgi:alkaline phosphatase D
MSSGSTPGFSRRRFLQAAGGLAAGTLAGRAPAIIAREPSRPSLAQGAAVGDVTGDTALVWSRADRPSRLFVEYSTTDSFRNISRVAGPAALESTDFTARVQLTGLPAGQRIFYRALFQDLTDLRSFSAPAAGSFTTPAADASSRDVTLIFSADTVGQGWGINPEWGGLRLFETMRQAEADVFIQLGDTIYADQPVLPEVKLDDGRVWRNLVTPAKSRVAQTLEDYRGNYLYNLQDEHMRRFNASVSQVVIWDDHEVRDNWYPTRPLAQDERYQEKSMALIAARARQAFLEYNPLTISTADRDRVYRSIPFGPLVETFALDMRSYRGPNSANQQNVLSEESALLGAEQVRWLKARLAASRATWKVIASDLPIGVIVRDYPDRFEAVANAEPGLPLGRELEIAGLLKFIRDERIQNVVWITADVHYCAAHHYSPERAKFTDFAPFWEFVAGPLNAGTFGPNELDQTFGPEVKFVGIPPGMKPNRPPWDGYQFFGKLRIDAKTHALSASLHDLSGRKLFGVELAPASRA